MKREMRDDTYSELWRLVWGVFRLPSSISHLSAFFLTLLCALPAQSEWIDDTQAIMGTEIRLVLWHEDPQKGRAAINAVMDEMRRIDRQFSFYKPDSELSNINREAAGKPVSISHEMASVLQKALFYGDLTDGAFDITFASVGQHYDYREKLSPDELQQQRAVIDYRRVRLDMENRTVAFAHPAIKIDLGGIVKGYAVDRAAAILLRWGIASASISAGGDSYILGDRRGRPWMVGIRNPRRQGVALSLPLDNVAFSTSGDYERFFFDAESGERIHHIINPSTKRSARDIMSVSVMGPRGFDTDPLSTSVFVLGVDKGLRLLNSLPDFDGVIIDGGGKVYYSDGLQTPE